MVSFIDFLSTEYIICQNRLYDDAAAFLPNVQNDIFSPFPEATSSLKPTTDIVTYESSAKKIEKRTLPFTRLHSDFSISVPVENRLKVRACRDEYCIGILNLNLSPAGWENVEKMLSGYDQKLDPIVSSSCELEKMAILGEVLLQEFLSPQVGIHLVIAPKRVVAEMRQTLLYEIFSEGMFTCWQIAKETKEAPRYFDRLSEQLDRALHKKDAQKADDKNWVSSLFRLFALFSFDMVQESLRKHKLITVDFLRKLKTVTQKHLAKIDKHIQYDEEEDMLYEEIASVAESILKLLPETSAASSQQSDLALFRQKIFALSHMPEQMSSLKALARHVQDCYEVVSPKIRETAHSMIIVGHYLLAVSILALDPRRWSIQDRANYPEFSMLEPLLWLSPAQLMVFDEQKQFAGQDKTKHIVIFAAAESMPSVDVATLLPMPLRSLHLYGYEKSHRAEWQEIVTAADRLKTEAIRLYPQEPLFNRARYCETADPFFHGFVTEKI